MTVRRLTILTLAALLLSESALAEAADVRIGRYSYQATPQSAGIGASVEVSVQTPGHSTGPAPGGGGSSSDGGSSGFVYPTLPAGSPRLRDSTPAGADSLWYDDGAGHSCIYVPEGSSRCFAVTDAAAPGGRGVRIDPIAMAAAAAARLPLLAGSVAASPPRPVGGLTGVRSWFWLEPAPSTRQASVSAGRETVTVTAVPEVAWLFGDGAGHGSALGYRPRRVPGDAEGHGYETRCLVGDRGRNPYVLSTCGADGYQVEASVTWSISYSASGPIVASGTLPARTTSASMPYPVGESRAFLTTVGGRR